MYLSLCVCVYVQVPMPLTEPFRVVLSNMRDRLYMTREVLQQCLVHRTASVRAALAERGAYVDVEEIYKPLKLMYDSLMNTGDESVANARLLDLIRQVRTCVCVCVCVYGAHSASAVVLQCAMNPVAALARLILQVCRRVIAVSWFLAHHTLPSAEQLA